MAIPKRLRREFYFFVSWVLVENLKGRKKELSVERSNFKQGFLIHPAFQVIENVYSDGAGQIFYRPLGVNLGDKLIDGQSLFCRYGFQFFKKFFFQRNAGCVAIGYDDRLLGHDYFLRKASIEITSAEPEALRVGAGSSSSSSIFCPAAEASPLLKLRPNFA